jgi:thioredoxin 1
MFGVMSIPTVIIFKDGKIVDQKVGVQPKQSYLDSLQTE